MTNTYQQIQKQIEELSREAEELKRKEIGETIERIKEAIAVYGLTAADLGFVTKRSRSSKQKTDAAKKQVRTVKVKYRDDNGNTWTGRGLRPRWLRDALASGKTLDEFAV